MADEQGEIVIRDATGTEHIFPAGFDPKQAAAIVRQSAGMAPAGSSLPGRFGGNAAADRAEGSTLSKLNDMLEPMAHPSTLSDFAGLLIPSGGAGGIADRAIQAIGKLPLARIGLGAAGAAYGGATAPEHASVPATLGRMAEYGIGGALAPNILRKFAPGAVETADQLATKAAAWNNPWTVAGREANTARAAQRFNELPLAKQMEQLPNSGSTPERGRLQDPPMQAPAEPADPTLALIEKEVAAGRIPKELADGYKKSLARPATAQSTGLRPISRAATAPALQPIAETPPNVADAPISQALGTPRILTPKATPTSWTPEAARARLELEDWHSGAEPGSIEAHQASTLHREDAALKQRMLYQLANKNGAIAALASAPALIRQIMLGQLTQDGDSR